MNILSRIYDRLAARHMRKELATISQELSIHYSEHDALLDRAKRRNQTHGFMDSLSTSFDLKARQIGHTIAKKEARIIHLETQLKKMGRPRIPPRPVGPLE